MAKQTKTSQTQNSKKQGTTIKLTRKQKQEAYKQIFEAATKISKSIVDENEGFRINETVKGLSLFGNNGRIFKILSSGRIEINIQVSKQEEETLKKLGFIFYENPKNHGNVRYYGLLNHTLVATNLKAWGQTGIKKVEVKKEASNKSKTGTRKSTTTTTKPKAKAKAKTGTRSKAKPKAKATVTSIKEKGKTSKVA